jgi:hypothetical protein
MKRLFILLPLVVLGLTTGAASGESINACPGLQVCVPVSGPWTVTPARDESGVSPRVEYQLSCPRNYVVGGFRVDLASYGVDAGFLGRLGSPVEPGVVTSRAAVFYAIYTRDVGSGSSFRPHIGCVPAAGGGAPVQTSYPLRTAAFAPRHATSATASVPAAVRYVRNVRIRAGRTQEFSVSCRSREHLVVARRALGFFTKQPPSSSLVSAVSTSLSTSRTSMSVSVRSSGSIAGVRTTVQLTAICAGNG